MTKFTGFRGDAFGVKTSRLSLNLPPVKQWLIDVVGLPQYYPNFEQHGFDTMASVKRLVIEQLDILGMKMIIKRNNGCY